MEEKEYLRWADECLGAVAKWLETLDPDEVDYVTGDGVVTIEFPDDSKFILSRQAATSQIWFAADARAWHYNFDSTTNRWVDDRDGHDLYGRIAEVISERVGHTVEFDA
ncbi:MAG TPA: iron donor protein CyaY [Candidatus Binataceae bacterium]|jgi:CyaY protein